MSTAEPGTHPAEQAQERERLVDAARFLSAGWRRMARSARYQEDRLQHIQVANARAFCRREARLERLLERCLEQIVDDHDAINDEFYTNAPEPALVARVKAALEHPWEIKEIE